MNVGVRSTVLTIVCVEGGRVNYNNKIDNGLI